MDKDLFESYKLMCSGRTLPNLKTLFYFKNNKTLFNAF